MAFEQALLEHLEQVDTLLKAVNKYANAVKAWKKACEMGNVVSLQKSSASAVELLRELPAKTSDTKETWTFDIGAYLESLEWRDDLKEAAAQKSLRTIEDGDTLLASPLVIRSQPTRGALLFGKSTWSDMRPSVVAEYLKKLREKATKANSADFLESMFTASVYLGSKQQPTAKFRDIYKMFSLTPGYKKDNTPTTFGQQIYALQRAEIQTTRAGHTYEIETISGSAKDSDTFPVMTEDGRLVRYYTIYFKVV